MEATKHLATFVRLASELLDGRWSGGAQVPVNTPYMYIRSLLSGKSSPFQCLVPERRPAWFRSPARLFIPQATGVNHGQNADSRDPLDIGAVMTLSALCPKWLPLDSMLASEAGPGFVRRSRGEGNLAAMPASWVNVHAIKSQNGQYNRVGGAIAFHHHWACYSRSELSPQPRVLCLCWQRLKDALDGNVCSSNMVW